MNIKASGRSALIIAAGFLVCFSGPLQAAEDADGGAAASKTESAAGAPIALNKFAKHKSRHWKQASSHRKPVKVASRALAGHAKTAEKKKTVDADASAGLLENKAGNSQSAIPPSVANANAQLASADAPPDSAIALSAQASNRLQILAVNQSDPQAPPPAANTELVSADQLNDVDRALSEDKPAAAPAVALAAAQAPAVISSEDSAWGQTSLIGKIFIAFGGLLTLASAARMFMA
jgi:hypothetical protein